MIKQQSDQRHPFSSLLLLLLLSLIGAVVFTLISFAVGYSVYNPASIQDLLGGQNIGFQKVMLAFSSIGMFVLPPLVFAYIERKQNNDYLTLHDPSPYYLIPLAILIMICVTPFIEWTVFINDKMKLPPFLQELESWMRSKEDELEDLTKNLLVMKKIPDVVLNVLVIAVIPAIGEEFTFRGCIQPVLQRWVKNYHVAIWITAIFFSAIHLQFYGFFPRMILGALFGYMLVWTKSIWVPVTAHFYNNASAVVGAYVLQKEGKPIDIITEASEIKWYLVVVSIIFSSLLLWTLRKISLNKLNTTSNE